MATGCARPPIPSPPPVAVVQEPPDLDGIVTVTGSTAEPGAFVTCLNERTETGVTVRGDLRSGDFTLRIAAESDDTLTLWEFRQSNGTLIHLTVQ